MSQKPVANKTSNNDDMIYTGIQSNQVDKTLLTQCLEALTSSRNFLVIDLNTAIEQGRDDAVIEKEIALRNHDDIINKLKARQ
jgi:hypothetical protein